MNVSDWSTRHLTFAAAATATATLAVGLVLGARFSKIDAPTPRTTIPSPRTTLLRYLNPAQTASLGYPPDALPGARDVSTPYGYMRVYEWGPIEGRRVVLVHGDATPAPLFGGIAGELVRAGCRVLCFGEWTRDIGLHVNQAMVPSIISTCHQHCKLTNIDYLDLWGRGYSDTPSGVQHDSRLYSQQIHFAIASSPISWMGSTEDSLKRFSLIGFSMGSTIVLDFFASYASHIEGIVLLGPGGLIRKLPYEYTRFWFRHPNLISGSAMRRLIGTLLDVDLKRQPLHESAQPRGFTPAGALQFQYDHHLGHVESMLSNVQYGPLQRQGAIWRKACDIISGRSSAEEMNDPKPPMYNGKILVVCGRDDSVVIATDVEDDLKQYLGSEDHYEFKTVPGGHGFPWAEAETTGKHIIDFWKLGPLQADQ